MGSNVKLAASADGRHSTAAPHTAPTMEDNTPTQKRATKTFPDISFIGSGFLAAVSDETQQRGVEFSQERPA